MKKYIKIITPIIFSMIYGTISSLCLLSFLKHFEFLFLSEVYPNFYTFVSIVAYSTLTVLIGLLFLNLQIAEKLDYLNVMWILQFIGAIVITIPMIKVWGLFFDFLRATF